jgi:Uma2 family endonuclease
MVFQIQKMSVEQFDEWVNFSENTDSLFEFIGSEVVKVPSNPYSSSIGTEISFRIKLYLHEKNIDAHITGEQGGYMVSGNRYAPDVAYLSKEKQEQLVRTGYNPNPPDLAVEVISPSDSDTNITIKVVNYLAAGTVVWVVRPETKKIEVYTPKQPVKIFGEEDTLDGGTVLPDFMLPVKTIFPD